MSYVTDEMENGLRSLQTVTPFDFTAAYHVAYAGGHCLRPMRSDAAAAWFHGRSLALALWARRMHETTELRSADS